MPIWKLTPIDTADPGWEASSHCGLVLARAPDEAAARAQAQSTFGVKTTFPPGRAIVAPPWQRSQLVRAEIVKDARYDDEGPTEVLLPAFEADLQPAPRRT